MINFDKMIDEYVYRRNIPKQKGKYYPSEIGNCMRKVWYTYKYPKEVDPDLRKIFEMGNILHDFVVEVLKSEKTPEVELVKSEFPFRFKVDDFTVSGRIDDLILVKEKRKLVLVEVKSTKFLDYVKEPTASHVMQLQLYMHAMGVQDGVVLYIEKNTLMTKTFKVKYSKKKAQH